MEWKKNKSRYWFHQIYIVIYNSYAYFVRLSSDLLNFLLTFHLLPFTSFKFPGNVYCVLRYVFLFRFCFLFTFFFFFQFAQSFCSIAQKERVDILLLWWSMLNAFNAILLFMMAHQSNIIFWRYKSVSFNQWNCCAIDFFINRLNNNNKAESLITQFVIGCTMRINFHL